MPGHRWRNRCKSSRAWRGSTLMVSSGNDVSGLGIRRSGSSPLATRLCFCGVPVTRHWMLADHCASPIRLRASKLAGYAAVSPRTGIRHWQRKHSELSTVPYIGMRANSSHVSRVSRRSPHPPPRTQATGLSGQSNRSICRPHQRHRSSEPASCSSRRLLAKLVTVT